METYSEIISKFLSGTATSDETYKLTAWRAVSTENEKRFQEIAQLWEITDQQEEIYEPNIKAGWQQIQQKISDHETEINDTKRSTLTFVQWSYRIAAGLVLLIGLGFFINFLLNNDSNSVTIQADVSVIEHLMPDSTVIWLNKSSSITYDPVFAKRIVYLTGEAFFDVKRNEAKPFQIFGQGGKVEVLGTSFTVTAHPDKETVEVSVVTGKVAFSDATRKQTPIAILTPGLKGTLQKQKHIMHREVNKNANFRAWQTKNLVFERDSISYVVATLNEYFDNKIEIKNSTYSNQTFTGNFSDPEAEEILDAMSFTMGITYQKNGNTYQIN